MSINPSIPAELELRLRPISPSSSPLSSPLDVMVASQDVPYFNSGDGAWCAHALPNAQLQPAISEVGHGMYESNHMCSAEDEREECTPCEQGAITGENIAVRSPEDHMQCWGQRNGQLESEGAVQVVEALRAEFRQGMDELRRDLQVDYALQIRGIYEQLHRLQQRPGAANGAASGTPPLAGLTSRVFPRTDLWIQVIDNPPTAHTHISPIFSVEVGLGNPPDTEKPRGLDRVVPIVPSLILGGYLDTVAPGSLSDRSTVARLTLSTTQQSACPHAAKQAGLGEHDSPASSTPANSTPSTTAIPPLGLASNARSPRLRTYGGKKNRTILGGKTGTSHEVGSSEAPKTSSEAPKRIEAPEKLELILERYLESAKCTVCLSVMLRPYSRSSIHTGHSSSDCQQIPKNKAQLLVLLAAIRTHGSKAEGIFCFKCPICRSSVKRQPTPNYSLKNHFDNLRGALGRRLKLLPSEFAPQVPQNPFSGLFLVD
ncbi:hypothetical protein DFP72DRAFT_1052623 [Ephemerocybe angulata]|uniref:Uncharacterized protein n=1 Tax=Ephemerocybe angulata TaxID=980116 RepID=A0A8H6HB02_9AGAR|nr:hypothetical protein DFP72DRAFT_1052623 [Tulosesus angulatus]